MGQRSVGDPIPAGKYNGLSENEKRVYTRGILRVLGIEGREKDVPTTRKHEIFIPYPPEMEIDSTFDVQEAVDRFQNLAKERTQAEKDLPFHLRLPFHLKGSKRNSYSDPENANIELREGDLVFFRVSDNDPEKVGEVAISSIWRRRTDGNSYDYFRQISPEVLPFSPEREVITIAEQLFGFVEQRQKDEENMEGNQKESTLSFASRLRFSFGILEGDEEELYQSEVLLKILDSPKPPCPSFYFKPRNNAAGGFIAKRALNPDDHIPQGRKFYLHRDDLTSEPWKSRYEENLKQKSRVSPLRSGLTFYFHIDFDNLSRRELSLLCYALNPSDTYRHKIGMGKSIGLGKIQIIPEGLFIVDRMQRYREDDIFSSSRYHRSWVRNGAHDKWPETYAREKRSATLGGITSPEGLRNEFADSMDKDIQSAIELIGNPQSVRYPVHTPQIVGKDIEKETFRWFEEKIQPLRPLKGDSEELPTLDG